MIRKSSALPVDAVMLDLEDGVAPSNKPEARDMLADVLRGERLHQSQACYVRVNSSRHPDIEGDLDAVVTGSLDGLVLPKVESSDEVNSFADRIAELERSRGIERGRVRLLLAIESPRALVNAPQLAQCSPRVSGLIFGAEDFGLEIGLPTVREGEARELVFARSSVVVAAAMAGVQSVDGVWPDIGDQAGLLRDCRQSRRLGFTGKSLIHPSQVDPINEAFTPSQDDIALASEVIDAFVQAQSRGEGAVAFRGQLIDKPIYDRAIRTLDLARALGLSS